MYCCCDAAKKTYSLSIKTFPPVMMLYFKILRILKYIRGFKKIK